MSDKCRRGPDNEGSKVTSVPDRVKEDSTPEACQTEKILLPFVK